MRKILQTLRSRNHDAIYLVIRDGDRQTMEVWQFNSSNNTMVHCRTWPFEFDPRGPMHRSSSETRSARAALTLADELSRMRPEEVIKQFDNLREFGEVR